MFLKNPFVVYLFWQAMMIVYLFSLFLVTIAVTSGSSKIYRLYKLELDKTSIAESNIVAIIDIDE